MREPNENPELKGAMSDRKNSLYKINSRLKMTQQTINLKKDSAPRDVHYN